jgi:hypothetical protein
VFAVSGWLGFYPKYFGLFNVYYYFVSFGLEIATERQALGRWRSVYAKPGEFKVERKQKLKKIKFYEKQIIGYSVIWLNVKYKCSRS